MKTPLKLVTDENSIEGKDPILDRTMAYPVIDVKICPTNNFAKVADIATGGKRKRRYAMTLAMSGIPDFANQPEPMIFPPKMDTVILDADSIEDLRERAIKEIDIMVDKIAEAAEHIKKTGKLPEDSDES